ncbi:hypothetical protein [Acidithiobacillus sulfurivorans]|uniref:TubC N-terminal docking domain-containing protein n=1 Tax=Acidithiobacillus sulfurivorans TaxID=1958756 RepID=A0ABS5ZZZ0_9PROT|nr:hypothetical protein [Acidithiobacillus sulfurivorans]MBU2760580.1 hypothetical protein [Acidithiobacillus sulfurivorans]
MKPSNLVAELRAAGLNLSTIGGKLKVGPADLLTDELRQSIRERRAEIIRTLAAESAPAVESHPSTTQPASVRPEPRKVACGECSRFLPDTINPAQGLGRCNITGTGPPSGGSGYKACYPMAPRQCPNFERNEP